MGWDEVAALGLRFDALSLAGGMDRCILLADRVRAHYEMSGGFTASPRELAACLAFECRSRQHCGVVPDGVDLAYLVALHASVTANPPS